MATVSPGYPIDYPDTYSHTWQLEGWTIQQNPLPNQNDVITGLPDTSIYDLIATSGLPAILIKNTLTHLYVLLISNQNMISTQYVRLYNENTVPVPGTDTSFLTVALLPGESVLLTSNAQAFSQGLGLGASGGPGDSDTTPVAGILSMHVVYS
jgi:hypothetical protein